ncbi:sulfotransferase [Rhodopirellula sp. MGV]|uniref:sulfotransferase n=1 Tax=Rhodopirellula sp. MGV TaxID=2023130 RepID=UPI0013044A1D|nr:sulfotransferase [Rhodopirellula sp. MGV]
MGIKLTVGKLRDAWMEYSKQSRVISQFPGGKPIFIGGTHRSGTTWFAKMLAEPGLWYIHEPYNPNKGFWHEEFSYTSINERSSEIDRYMTGLLRGRYRSTSLNANTDHALMPLRLLRPTIRRVMVKDPLACLLSGYFTKHFDFRTIVLFRHPAGFVSSVLRLGWPIGKFIRSFLNRSDLLDDHLAPFRSLMVKHQDGQDAAAATVLHGLLNTVMWNQVRQNSAITWYQFEDLCRQPIESFREIHATLGLPYDDSTLQRHESLCFQGPSRPDAYHTHAVARRSSAMADSWKQQLSSDQQRMIRNVWDEFEIPLYHDAMEWTCRPPKLETSVV